MSVVTAMIARELGGKSYALFLSALAAAIAPMYLSNGGLFTTNFMEPLFWMGCAYFAILAIKRNDPRYWVWFGVVLIRLNNKYSITVFGLGIVIGLASPINGEICGTSGCGWAGWRFLIFRCPTSPGMCSTTRLWSN